MPLSYALTTVARQKQFQGISNASYDTILDRLVDSATDWIEGYCDRRFKETTYTNEEYDGTGSAYLQLRNFPVDSASTFTLQNRDSMTNENNWSTIDTELYFVNYKSGIVKLVAAEAFLFSGNTDFFIRAPLHYRVTYTAGYDYDLTTTFLSSTGIDPNNTTKAYSDLEYACWKLVTAAYNQRRSSGNVLSESIGDYSITFTKEAMMDDEVKEILQRYRRFPG